MVILQTVIITLSIFSLSPDINTSYLKTDSMEQCVKVMEIIKGTYNYETLKNTETEYLISHNIDQVFIKRSINHRCVHID